MSLKTYVRRADGSWPLCSAFGGSGNTLVPGDAVSYLPLKSGAPVSGYGTVIACDGASCTVLWSQQPTDDGFDSFVMPVARRVYPSLVANSIVSVQPMSAPVGSLFYLDYTYPGAATKDHAKGPTRRKKAHRRPKKRPKKH